MAQSVSIVRVSRALEVLSSSQGEGMSLEELAETMEISRPAALRLFESMVETGIAVRTGAKRYRLSLKSYEWGVKAVSIVGPSVTTRREMSRLATNIGHRVWYAVREDASVLAIEGAEFHDGDVLNFPVALRRWWWQAASGTVIAAFSAPNVQRDLIAAIDEQDSGPIDHHALLDLARREGVAWQRHEGAGTGIAVPILDSSGHASAAIGVTIQGFDGLDPLVQPLKEAAARASDYLGYSQALLVT